MLIRWFFAYVAFMITVGAIVGSAVIFYQLFDWNSNVGVGMFFLFVSIVGVGGTVLYWANYLAVGWWGTGYLFGRSYTGRTFVPDQRERDERKLFGRRGPIFFTGDRATDVFLLVLGGSFVAFFVWMFFVLD